MKSFTQFLNEDLNEAKIDDFTNRYMKYHASHPMVQRDPEEAKRRIGAANPHVQGHDEAIYATKQFLDKTYNPNEDELSLKHVLKGWRKGKTSGDLTGNLSDHTHDSISRFLRSQSDAKSTVKAGKLEGMDKYQIGQIQHPEHGVLDVHQVHVNDVKDDDEFKKISDTIKKHTSSSCTWCVKGDHDVAHLKHYSHGHGILFYTNQRGEMVRSHGFGDRGIVNQDNTTIRPQEAHHIQKQTSALMTGKKKEVYDFFLGDTKNLSAEKQHKMYDEFGKGHAEAHFADPKRNTHPVILSRMMKSENSEVRIAAVSHPNATHEHISQGLKDEYWVVRKAAVSHPNATHEHISQGLKDEYPGVRHGAQTAMDKRLKTESLNAMMSFTQFLNETAAWTRKAGKNPKGGLNAKGVASYRAANPGSKLKMAVTTKPSKLKPGSKAAKRRKSFCARMGGMPGPMKDEKGRPTRKALSLRKWNC